MNEQEEEEDHELQTAPAKEAFGNPFNAERSHLAANYTIWETHLGVPSSWISYAFPAWWSMVVAPAVLLTFGVAAHLSSNGVLFSEALAISDVRWLPTTALSTWSYHWCIVRAVCHGITDAFHGVFVEVPQHLFTRPSLTWQHFWNFSTNGTDFLNLFAADVPQYNELVEGDFHGNFHTFRATVMLMRLLLTVLFACLRLIAVIARTPDRDDSDESHESWLEEAEDIVCP